MWCNILRKETVLLDVIIAEKSAAEFQYFPQLLKVNLFLDKVLLEIRIIKLKTTFVDFLKQLRTNKQRENNDYCASIVADIQESEFH